MTGERYTQINEGCILTAKPDRGGNQVIGWGHNGPDIKPGTVWTQAQADGQFALDYARAKGKAALVLGPAWSGLDYVRRCALIDMAFELGGAGLAQFHRMLLAIGQGAWDSASAACLDSAYAEQVPRRANANAAILATGKWPAGIGA